MNTKIKITFALIFVTLLIGCTTPERRAELDRQAQYRAQQAQDEYVERLNSKCVGYGFQRGTTAFAQCMQQAEQQESMNSALQLQKTELERQEKVRKDHQTKCWLLGKLEC